MIINSVIIGGGSGDEVEAYALGDAKNAVKDDKVALNFSANMATIEPEISGKSSAADPGGLIMLSEGGEYIYTGQTHTYGNGVTTPCYKKDYSGGYSLTTSLKAYGKGNTDYLLANGLYLINNTSSTSNSSLVQLLGTGSSYLTFTQISTQRQYGVAQSADNNVAIVTSSSSSYPCLLLVKKDGVYSSSNLPISNEGFWASIFIIPEYFDGKLRAFWASRGYTKYRFIEIDPANLTAKILKTVENTTYWGSSIDELWNGCCFKGVLVAEGSSNSPGTSLNNIKVRKYTDDGQLSLAPKAQASLQSALASLGGINRFRLVDGYLVARYNNKDVRLDYDPDTETFIVMPSPFSDKDGGYTSYFPGGFVSWSATNGGTESTDFEIRRQLAPIDQPYVATEPVEGHLYVNQTLTGFVKENINGILKVSTVEDPNNPPPAVPDEAGLKTTINYGGDVSINPNLVITSGITKSGTDLSGFTNSSSYKVTADSPFTSLSSMSSFDIVMCATRSADGGYYHWLAGLTDSANAYRGFDIRTQGNDFLEANIYHEDGTSTYLKSGTTLPTNTKTFIKLSYNSSSGYTMSFSSDGFSYAQVASAATTKPMDLTPPTLFLGWRPQKQQATYYWNGTIHLADCYFNVNGTKIWSGTKVNFGSVGVGYGYFRNPLSKPSDKYISYEGGTLTEDNIYGSKATTLNIILGRSADMGSWTSDTEGYLSARDSVVLGVNKKLPTPVYLWHDLSYITPAVPETIEPDVVVREDNAQVLQNVTTTGVTVDEHANITGFDGGGKRMAYINSPLYNKSVSSIDWWFSFTTGISVTSIDRMICGFYDSVDGGDVNGFFLKTNNNGRVCLGHGTASGSYWATGYSSLSTSTRYIVNIKYNASSGFTVIVQKGDDGSVVETLTAATTVTTTAQYLIFGCNVAAGGGSYNWNGSIGLGSYYITVDDTTTYFATPYTGSVSLPVSWKNIDGVLYEYPNGFPKTQASAITVKYPRLNVDVIGSPAVSSLSGDVSGFTTSDFLRVPYKYWKEDLSTPGSGFDIDIAFSVDEQVSPGQYVLGGSTNNAPITLGFTSAGNMEVDVYCTAETTKTFRMSYAGAIEVGNRYVFRIGYNTFAGYYVTRSTNNGEPETLVTNSTTTPPYMFSLSELWLGRAAYDLVATGLVVHLADCAIYLNGEKKWEGLDPDTTIGEPALYATKTGDSCGFAISRKAPKGVDSSAVIGTLELDANGGILSYTPGE